MKKNKKIFTRIICVLLASLLLVMSPVSKYFDTQHIDKVEASATVPILGGLGLFYLIAQTLGYDVSTENCANLLEDFLLSIDSAVELASSTRQEIKDLLRYQTFPEVISLKLISNILVTKIQEYLLSQTYSSYSYTDDWENDYTSSIHYANAFTDIRGNTHKGYSKLINGVYTAMFGKDVLHDTYTVASSGSVGFRGNDAYMVFFEGDSGKGGLGTYYACAFPSLGATNTDANGFMSDYVASAYNHMNMAFETIIPFSDGVHLCGFDDSMVLRSAIPLVLNEFEYNSSTGKYQFSGNQVNNNYFDLENYCFASNYMDIRQVNGSASKSIGLTFSQLTNKTDTDMAMPSYQYDIYNHGLVDTVAVSALQTGCDISYSDLEEMVYAHIDATSSSYDGVYLLDVTYPITYENYLEDCRNEYVYPVTDKVFEDVSPNDPEVDFETIQFLSALLSGFGIYISYDWLTDGNNAKELEETIEENYEEVRLQVVSSGSPLHDDDDDEDNDIDIDKIVDFATFKGKIMESQMFNMNEAFQNGAMSIILTFISGIITQIIADNISNEVIWVHPDIEQTFENDGVLEVAPPSKAWVFPSADTLTEMQEGFDLPQTELSPEIKHGYIGDFIEETDSEPIFYPQTYPSYNPVVNPDVEPDDSPNTDEDPDIDENLSFWEKLWEWLKKLWQALINILSKLGLLDVLNYILNAINQIGELLSNLFGNVSLMDILNAIFNLPSNIASALLNALGSLLETLFVPDTVALEATLDDFGNKFPWVETLFGYFTPIRDAINQNSSSPPVIYIHFENSENPRYKNLGTMKVFDGSWYAPYKSMGDSIISAFLWLFFIWRLIKNIPNIINGGGMIVESHAEFDYAQSKNFGSAKDGTFRKG